MVKVLILFKVLFVSLIFENDLSLTSIFSGIFDIRQRRLLHTFQAHDSTIKCFAVDPSEEFFVSGSADGDIKVR